MTTMNASEVFNVGLPAKKRPTWSGIARRNPFIRGAVKDPFKSFPRIPSGEGGFMAPGAHDGVNYFFPSSQNGLGYYHTTDLATYIQRATTPGGITIPLGSPVYFSGAFVVAYTNGSSAYSAARTTDNGVNWTGMSTGYVQPTVVNGILYGTIAHSSSATFYTFSAAFASTSRAFSVAAFYPGVIGDANRQYAFGMTNHGGVFTKCQTSTNGTAFATHTTMETALAALSPTLSTRSIAIFLPNGKVLVVNANVFGINCLLGNPDGTVSPAYRSVDPIPGYTIVQTPRHDGYVVSNSVTDADGITHFPVLATDSGGRYVYFIASTYDGSNMSFMPVFVHGTAAPNALVSLTPKIGGGLLFCISGTPSSQGAVTCEPNMSSMEIVYEL